MSRPASTPHRKLAHWPAVRFFQAMAQKLPVSMQAVSDGYRSAGRTAGGVQLGLTHCMAA